MGDRRREDDGQQDQAGVVINPLRIKGSGYGRFTSFDTAIPEGCTAIVGGNGAGKSRLLNAIELALFADGGRDLALWLAPGADRLELELEFEHAGETYRVRRGYRQTGSGGKVTLDFEKRFGTDAEIYTDDEGVKRIALTDKDQWFPLTRETTSATQQLIVDTLGLSRRTFAASSFLAQGNAAAFPEASPADRKGMLGEIIDPRGLWAKLADRAKADSLAVGSAISADLTRIAERETAIEQIPNVEQALIGFREGVTLAEQTVTGGEKQIEEAQAELAANATAVERVRIAETERNHAATAQAAAKADVEKIERAVAALPAARAELAAINDSAGDVALLEQKLDNQRTARAVAAEAESKCSGHTRDAERLEADANRHLTDAAAAALRQDAAKRKLDELRDAEDGAAHCDRCEQTLGRQAREAAIASLQAEFEKLETEIVEKQADRAAAENEANLSRAAAAAIEIPFVIQGDFEAQLSRARSAAALRPGKALLVDGYMELEAKLPEALAALEAAQALLVAKSTVLAQASESVKDSTQFDRAFIEGKATVATARRVLDAARADVVRNETELERLNTAKTEIEELRRTTVARQAELDLLKLAEKAFGRDGIPVLLVENVIPQIEAYANEFLEQLPTEDGDVLRVELITQRENKTTDTLRETLDILVYDRDGSRSYETYSGGERERVNISLRIALALLLANRRGAESRMLAIDEPEGLDELGQEKLVELLRSIAGHFDRVIVVSHHANVRDAFENVIEITKTDGVSRVGAAVLEEAIA